MMANQRSSKKSNHSAVREDSLDVRMIHEAREADKGKQRLTVNELRAHCGLAPI